MSSSRFEVVRPLEDDRCGLRRPGSHVRRVGAEIVHDVTPEGDEGAVPIDPDDGVVGLIPGMGVTP